MGHLQRCLTLGAELSRRELPVQFFVAGDPRGPEVARKAGFVAGTLADDAGFLDTLRARRGTALAIVDDYGVDDASLAAIAALAPTAVIDDLADRTLEVDVIINGNANATELAYRAGTQTVLLLGTPYSLLRPEFRAVPPHQLRSRIERILVTLGGADALDQTAEIVDGLLRGIPNVYLDVVIGPLFRRRDVGRLPDADSQRVVLYHAPAELVSLMRAADLAITAGGQTTYEVAACGLPSVALCTADNQRGTLRALEHSGTLAIATNPGAAIELARALADDVDRRAAMSVTGRSRVDGFGSERVATALMSAGARRGLA
jgi:UDP-2,4-diacetamido-2,4,6-trideoxy-beta-L-altropyranose hydrolase